MAYISEKQIRYLEYINRENEKRHHRYDEEMGQYRFISKGDRRSMEEREKLWNPVLYGKALDDAVRNLKYIFVASLTLACRAAIVGGVEEERAYNISDLYIRQVDQCETVEQIDALHKEMFTVYTGEAAAAKNRQIYSKPVLEAMDYIYYHLHEKITVEQLAGEVKLNPTYLSEIFKKEMGVGISEYILRKRVETAENMLKHSAYSVSEIAATLAFSSQSHFTQAFRKQTGVTPAAYRRQFSRA